MPMFFGRSRVRLLASAAFACLALPAFADEPLPPPPPADDVAVGTAAVPQVVVTESKSAVPVSVPNSTESVTKSQIDETINAMTSGEVLKYVPSVNVRERYIGDRNGILSNRTTGTVAAAQSIVYADDLLLSNFLGNNYSYPPRWGMVSPTEIERVDMLYGPFSAAYPGNSFGGVAVLSTRMPDKTEAHVDVKGFSEHFKQYLTDKDYTGYDGNMSVGSRVGPWSVWIAGDHLDSHGHPMQFNTVTSTSASASSGTATGGTTDVDPTGKGRMVLGATNIDHTVQDLGKIKVAYDLQPDVRLTYTLGLWNNRSADDVESYITNAAGQKVYNGTYTINGKKYALSMNPDLYEQAHLMNGLSLKSDTKGTFDYDLAFTNYTMMQDRQRAATNYGNDMSGTDKKMDGSGWNTADLRGIYRPKQELAGKHELSFGYHFDRYELIQNTYTNTNWRQGQDQNFSASSGGKTQTQGLYLQDDWKVLTDWTLTLGGREEFWDAFDGYNGKAGSKTAYYASRHTSSFSPKASLAYQVTEPLTERFSYGQAMRYPTVSELFQAITSGNSLSVNVPNLRPEDVETYEWSSDFQRNSYGARLSLFQENRRNAIISQLDSSTNTTYYQNVDYVRSRGVELSGRTNGLWLDKLDLLGSVTFVQSRVVSDYQNGSYVDKHTPNVPTWRAKFSGDYHVTEDLSVSSGMRYASRAYSNLDNSDWNGNVYGGASELWAFDSRVAYKLGNGFTAALGIDNAFGSKSFAYHPYPMTTVFGELKYDY